MNDDDHDTVVSSVVIDDWSPPGYTRRGKGSRQPGLGPTIFLWAAMESEDTDMDSGEFCFDYSRTCWNFVLNIFLSFDEHGRFNSLSFPRPPPPPPFPPS